MKLVPVYVFCLLLILWGLVKAGVLADRPHFIDVLEFLMFGMLGWACYGALVYT